MANEITVTASLSFTKGGITQTFAGLAAATFDFTGTEWIFIQANVAASEVALDYGSISTAGWFLFKNLDATNYVALRPGTGVADFAKVEAGEICLCRLAGTTVFTEANTAACDVQYLLLED